MHDGMPYDPIQGQGHETFKVRNSSIFKIYLLRHFLRASAMLKHVIAIGLTSVRPSVRHTLAPYQNG